MLKCRAIKRIYSIAHEGFHTNETDCLDLGTWRKALHGVSGRRPFAKDSQNLDYDCDSDEEWENMIDEGEVENIGDSDHEDEPEEADSEEARMKHHFADIVKQFYLDFNG